MTDLTKSRVLDIINEVLSDAMSLGHFQDVKGSEAMNAPPGSGITLAAWMTGIRPVPARSGLKTVSVRLGLTVRMYSPAVRPEEARDDIDPSMTEACAALMGLYVGGFTLGGQVAEVDLLGAHGDPLMSEDGHLQLDRKIFRIYDITLPLIINDLWTQAG